MRGFVIQEPPTEHRITVKMSHDAYYGATRLFAEQWSSSRTTIDDENNLKVSYQLLNGCDFVNNASTVEVKLNRSVVHASMGYLSKNSRQMQNDFCTSHIEIYYYPQNFNFDQLHTDSMGAAKEQDLFLTASKSDQHKFLSDHKKKIEEQLKPFVCRMLSKAYRLVHRSNVFIQIFNGSYNQGSRFACGFVNRLHRTCSLDFSVFDKFRDKNPSVNLACIINAISLVLVMSSLHLKSIIVAIPVIKLDLASSITNLDTDIRTLHEKTNIEAIPAGMPTAATFASLRLFAYSDGKCRPISAADASDAVDANELPSYHIRDVEASEAQKSAARLLNFFARAARLNSIAERVVQE